MEIAVTLKLGLVISGDTFLASRLTEPVNPFSGVTVIVELADELGNKVKSLGKTPSLKSTGGTHVVAAGAPAGCSAKTGMKMDNASKAVAMLKGNFLDHMFWTKSPPGSSISFRVYYRMMQE